MKPEKSLSLMVLFIIALCALGTCFPQAMQYDRTLILRGEFWRVLTCHFAHADRPHFLLNAGGTVIVFLLFGNLYSLRLWMGSLAGLMIGIGTALLMFSSDVTGYGGFSGVLYGLLAMGMMSEALQGRKIFALVIPVLIGKVALEQFAGMTFLTGGMLQGAICRDAHIYGIAIGFGYAWLLSDRRKTAMLFRHRPLLQK